MSYGGEDENLQDHLQDDIVKEALASGQDLREYSKQVEVELASCEQASIQDYISQAGNIAQLHNQISSCDGILARMENLLLTFQTDLGSISSEILSLQQESVDMNLRLKNRQGVRGELSQFVDDLVVTEQLISTIMETPVSEQLFLEQLQVLDHKIEFLKEQSFREARAAQDVKDVLEKLKIKSVAKIREYFLLKINQFKKPLANYQIPQNAMLRFKFYFQFLQKVNREVASEIREEYIDTMSKIMFSYFKSYSGRLAKLQYEESASRDDLLGAEESQVKGFFFKPSLKNKTTVFSVGSRGEVLTTELEVGEIFIVSILLFHHLRLQLSSLMHSRRLTKDTLTRCCLGRCSMPWWTMRVESSSSSPSSSCWTPTLHRTSSTIYLVRTHLCSHYHAISGKTLTVLVKQTDSSVTDSFDCISVFLCIHIVQRYQLLCHKRCVGGLDRWVDGGYGVEDNDDVQVLGELE